MFKQLRRKWERRFLRNELLLGLAIAGAFVLWAECYNGATIIQDTLSTNRSSVYGTWASILGALLGFAITTESIVLGFVDRRRFSRLAESPGAYEQLWDVFISCIRWLGLATVMALAGLLLDRDSAPKLWVLYVVFGTGALAAVRVLRTIWILEAVIRILTKPPKTKGADGAAV